MPISSARPRASLLLLAYNQERYVEEAARSCLAQECEPLEIVFSDDASSDRTHEILTAIAADYRGRRAAFPRSARRSRRTTTG